MKRPSRLKRILMIILSIVISFTIFIQIIKPTPTFQHVDDFFYTTTSYLKYSLIENPLNSIQEFFHNISSISTLRRENDKYRENLEKMNQMATQLEQTYRDNQALKELLELNETMVEYELTNTRIINRNQSHFNQYLMIDKGRSDGITTNMAVMSSLGLIGSIESVNDNSSTVKLLTNVDGQNKYSVLIQVDATTTINAILEKYDSENGTFEVRLLDASVSIGEGMKVITSGLGEIIPAGLLIGTIESIEDRSTTLSVIAHVTPAADFRDLNYLGVVLKGPFNDD